VDATWHVRTEPEPNPVVTEGLPATSSDRGERRKERAGVREWMNPLRVPAFGNVPDAAWAEADELRVAERSTFESNIYVQPEEAAERGVMRCRGT
jgi:hypothetical protein